MRKLHYAWTPDIKTRPFSEWIVLDDTMDDGGTVGLGDSWLGPDGRLHLVWQKEPIHPRLRKLYFPDIKRDWRMCYGVLKDGKMLEKRVLLAGGETTGPLRPTGIIAHPRLHVTPDHTRPRLRSPCIGKQNQQSNGSSISKVRRSSRRTSRQIRKAASGLHLPPQGNTPSAPASKMPLKVERVTRTTILFGTTAR